MPLQLKQKLTNLVPVLVLAVICFLSLYIVHGIYRDRIRINQQAAQLHLVTEVMSLPHDNDLLSDRIEISDRTFFNSSLPVTVYRARNNGQPVGLVFMPIMARAGYTPIQMHNIDRLLQGVGVHH